jgi:hypothetical protein
MVTKGVTLGINPQKLLLRYVNVKRHAFGFIFSSPDKCSEWQMYPIRKNDSQHRQLNCRNCLKTCEGREKVEYFGKM